MYESSLFYTANHGIAKIFRTSCLISVPEYTTRPQAKLFEASLRKSRLSICRGQLVGYPTGSIEDFQLDIFSITV